MTEPTKILIISNARWGKGTVCSILQRWGFKTMSSSEFALTEVMMPYFESIGKPYESPEACYDDRMNHRSTWYQQIETYNQPTWCRVTEEMFADGIFVYDGMRSPKELAASRHLYDHIVWVDASERLPPEDISSNGVTREDATYIIDNNGPEENLEKEVFKFVQSTGATPGSSDAPNWNYIDMHASYTERAVTLYDDLSREDLIRRIVDLETALHPVAETLKSFGEDSWRGTHATSKLFRLEPKEAGKEFYAYNRTTHQMDAIGNIPDSCRHAVDYAEDESIAVDYGTQLDDSFTLLAVHQQAPGAYVGCGSITMGDVRRMDKILNRPVFTPPKLPDDSQFIGTTSSTPS